MRKEKNGIGRKCPSSPLLSAFALDLFGFDVYTFPLGAAGARSFHGPLKGTEIRVLDKSSTATDAGTDSSACSRLHSWSIHHLREHEGAETKGSSVGEPTNPLDCGKKMSTADPADHPPPVSPTFGRIAQLY
jgi:hypothetical protein